MKKKLHSKRQINCKGSFIKNHSLHSLIKEIILEIDNPYEEEDGDSFAVTRFQPDFVFDYPQLAI